MVANMCPASSARVTQVITGAAGIRRRESGGGNQEAREELIPLVYDELRRLAGHHLGRERPDHTLQSAPLVQEACLRLVHKERPQWQNFLGVAAQLMRHTLVDHARNRLAAKRGVRAPRIALDAEIGLPQKRKVVLGPSMRL